MPSLNYFFSTGTAIDYKFNEKTFMSTDPLDDIFDIAYRKHQSIILSEDLDTDEEDDYSDE